MYFLNGDRIYLKPTDGNASPEQQLEDCLGQVKQINSGKKVIKLNFFVDTLSEEEYRLLQARIEELVAHRFSNPLITGVIAQPPLTSKILVEAFYYDERLWNSRFLSCENGSAMLFTRENSEILVGQVQVNTAKSCSENSAAAFSAFGNLLDQTGLPVHTVVRQWNYLEDILGLDNENQRYQEFNNVRSEFYGDAFKTTGYPAATGIGMNRGGIIIEFVAVRSDVVHTVPLDNPDQISAHDYSKEVLIGEACAVKSTPKFERARYLELFGKKLIFISGTASIRGEKTAGVGDPELQTEITIQNIQSLYSPEMLSQINENNLQPRYGHARVYVKRREDFEIIQKTFERYFGRLPVVYILADVCRDDLLVEIEGKVLLV